MREATKDDDEDLIKLLRDLNKKMSAEHKPICPELDEIISSNIIELM